MTLLTGNLIVGGHRIAHGVHGVEGSGGPVVLIHGTPSHSHIWRNVVPGLVASGHRVHLFDLLGFGRSERPADPAVDTSVSAQDAILLALMDHWGLTRAHIVSHDIGGAVGLRLGVFHPEKVITLTVIDTVSYDSWPSVTWRARIEAGLDALIGTPDADHRKSFGDQIVTAVHNKQRMHDGPLRQYLDMISGPVGQASFFQHQVRHYDSRHTEEISGRLKALGSLPVQIIWGENDVWQVPEWAHRLHGDIPDSTLHILPETGHFAMEDKPREITGLVTDFAGRHGA